ncbi:hypothetical protein KY290_032656 [Solanum tuberosum]|uniref:Endonuclease/exonuclease/phosphatase domain-containing protein n=1 Tax=Solanum tuberosum TaxID=4113 RepID=A0ABQ7UEI4_SOLTU|nr:hypothetical protein KY290_032656 [Solanum tuberosum]
MNCHITVVYGYNTGDKRKELWTNLRDLAIGMTAPWLICGDFNALLYPEDRLYDNPVQPIEIADFSNCLHDLSLNELSWKCDTWTNKQKGSDRICSIQWGHVVLNYGLPNISDHAPMMLNMTTQPSTKPPFRFFNVWAEHSSFLSLVEKEWQKRKATGHMKNIWIHLRSLKQKFAKLNQEEFKAVTQRLSMAKTELVNIHEQMVLQYIDGLQNQEKNILKYIEKWSGIEEGILKQKSRA